MNTDFSMLQFIQAPYRCTLNLIDPPAVVLLYHRVTVLEQDPRSLAVSPDNFYRQVEYIKRDHRLISAEEFAYLKKRGESFPPKSVLITFDDGYADNRAEALPILESLDAQAVFFIATLNIDSPSEFWWDRLEGIFLSGNGLPERLEMELNAHQSTFDTSTRDSRTKTYNAIRSFLRSSTAETQERVLGQLAAWAPQARSRKAYRSLTSTEIKTMTSSKAAVIGCHAHTHSQLNLYSYQEQLDDIRKSKDVLEAMTGSRVRHFSYPFGGKADYNSDTVKACKALELETAFSNYHAQVHRWTDRYQIPRMLARNWELPLFQNKIQSFFR